MNTTSQLSTNGALPYALKVNCISLFDLIALGEDQAKQLPWVGSRVWGDAKYLVSTLSVNNH